ncbi:ParB N-terminal domain-containing protein [Actinomadura graeca]|uniref:ParB N-terminal domain-containing protein n=1 Tax=Actinomadura graeca TaxID=2750812 RepID=A0ABX8R4Z2_9ACTN|nr:ParB N-terminal domain-containing protein [Actinomadura graeca]QXJ25908.1 ParB N-terminal domain-containing protein [Actinomadura graeca]
MTVDATAPPESQNAEPPAGAPEQLQQQPMISVSRLKPDPDNPRQNLDLNRAFLASLAHRGVQVPLLIRPDPGEAGMCVIIKGIAGTAMRWRPG